MKTSTEIEIVWEIWHLISRLNDLIWDLYENMKADLSDEDFPF
jgi:hypothetical protein